MPVRDANTSGAGEQHTANIFVLGLNEFNLQKLRALPIAARCEFHGLLDPADILDAQSYPIGEMLDRAEAQLRAFEGSVDAVIGYMDFPVSTMVPLIAAKFGLRAPSIESLLKCEHKYWSRVHQREVIPANIPAFEVFDPFDPAAADNIGLDFPFWVKPVKSAGSWLSFRIADRAQLDAAIEQIRAQINRFGEGFDYIMQRAALPHDIAKIRGRYCLAESSIGGHQCTVEGYAFNGEVATYGVIDSVRVDGSSSFARYQYPSALPARVQDQMCELTRRVIGHIGFDNSAFNVEFFWDEDTDKLWLLEINTRIAQHHSDLFQKVDGVSNHRVAVDIALGNRPQMPRGEGQFSCAACLWLRYPSDGVVTRIPTKREIAALERRFPGLVVEPHVEEGTRLSELVDQDSYSYVLAIIYLGARNERELLECYDQVKQQLAFEIDDRKD